MLGFVHVMIEPTGDKFFAGLLVVDHFGDPHELRVTKAVQTTTVQKLLWGQRLLSHILHKVILVPLAEQLGSQVEAIFVDRAEFLNGRQDLSVPLILLESRADVEEGAQSETSVTVPDSKGNGVLLLSCAPGFETDLEEGRRLVIEFSKTCYPLEPFQRIESVLKDLKPQLEIRAGAKG
ncbi:MAG TPA: hypothetical protein PLS55_01625 [Thermogutta sp.]|nr:hypothetical protein [Thermogutta sp.]